MARRLVAIVGLALVVGACSYTTPELSPVIPEDAESSQVYDADGVPLYAFHGVENRESVPLAQVPRHVQDAVLAIEDSRFWEHRGVDLRAVIRALKENVTEGEIVEGGSTITQQYVKNALLDSETTLDRKVQEAAVAFQLERNLSKEEILELYLNTIYFGAGAYGIEAASKEYFGKDVADLDLADGALLAGLIQAPSDYDPFRHPEEALRRRDLVTDRMESLGWISETEAAQLRAQDLGLRRREEEERYDAAYFVEEVKQFILDDPRFGETRQDRTDLLFQGGLRIETTLDPRVQAAAELAVERVLADPDRDPDAALVAIDPRTGQVRALVGGRDFFDGGPTSKLNLATQGRRPTGSSFKPIVLAAALEEGIGLDAIYSAPPHLEIPLSNGPWEVENYEGSGGGNVSLLDATVFSYNTAYAQLIQDVGPADAVQMGARLGITSPLLAVPSAVLGTNDVSPLDMTSAYATFAADGVHRSPVFVTRVEDRNGTVLYQWEDEGEQVIEPSVARDVTWALQQVMGRGTGVNARIGRAAAGKTGTGQDWTDAWFVGYTPDLVAGVWVGFAEGLISMTPPTTRQTVTGGSWPAQVWQLFMTDALATTPASDFPDRDGDADAGTEAETDPLDTLTPEQDAVVEEAGDGVPRVVGLPEDPAVDLLERQGLTVSVEVGPDDQFPAGIVAEQFPAAGEARPADSVVTIRVADGTAIRRAPAALGLVGADVVPELRAAGFDVQVFLEPEDDADAAEANSALVWKQEPAPGTALGPEESVRIWVNP